MGRYDEYIQSWQWQKKRLQKLAEVGWRCERCGEPARRTLERRLTGLEVHHLSYDHLGDEPLDELEVLCRACHEIEHGLAPDNDTTRELARRKIGNRIVAATTGHVNEIEAEIQAWDDLAEKAGL